ncbi:hypothetical protein F442_22094 [Phytophthora nicotianae P10297]|uniref:Uncharacterized protein n=1 Tax=Phytophthora nicotianae P10297 TaxID=1317064 RepID=W2Y0H7_PHYNI|nr:hypothetical protein F442_22094 [Phytophthora nicotianae P10297]
MPVFASALLDGVDRIDTYCVCDKFDAQDGSASGCYLR